ncbi:hypothetical protein ACJX0J_008514, partial [Zea mays]
HLCIALRLEQFLCHVDVERKVDAECFIEVQGIHMFMLAQLIVLHIHNINDPS